MTNTTVPINSAFYSDAKDYWAEIPATVNGMLGGYGHISQIDLQGSRHFLKQIFQRPDAPKKGRVLDCGAGIGRISKNLLTCIFDTVDLVEQSVTFLDEAKKNLHDKGDKVGEFYAVGLQDFEPKEKYDVIWIQWVLGHLTDTDFLKFFRKCKNALSENGIIIIKENITAKEDVEVDKDDSSVTRPYSMLIELFDRAGFSCYKKEKQTHFPKELFPVYMFALKPMKHIDIQEDSGIGQTMAAVLADYREIIYGNGEDTVT